MQTEPMLTEVTQCGPWYIVPGAILLSAIVGAGLALLAVAQQRLVAKKRAAHDFISELWSDRHFENEVTFRDLAKSGCIERVATPRTAAEVEEKLKVIRYMNQYELLAVAIEKNLVDEAVCKMVIIDQVLDVCDLGKPLIKKIIEMKYDDDGFYRHLRDLADRWRANPSIPKGRYWLIEIVKEIKRI